MINVTSATFTQVTKVVSSSSDIETLWSECIDLGETIPSEDTECIIEVPYNDGIPYEILNLLEFLYDDICTYESDIVFKLKILGVVGDDGEYPILQRTMWYDMDLFLVEKTYSWDCNLIFHIENFDMNAQIKYTGDGFYMHNTILHDYSGLYNSYETAVILEALGGTSSIYEITNTEFNNNGHYTYTSGGALQINNIEEDSTVLLNGVEFNENTASSAGAMKFIGYGLNITGCTFDSNLAYSYGGVIYLDNAHIVSISNSIFSNNGDAEDILSGGVIYALSSDEIEIRNSIFSDSGAYKGGVLFTVGCDEVGIYDSQMSGNMAELDGGAVYFHATSNVIISGTTFANNEAPDGSGGALYILYGSTFEIIDCVFRENYNILGGGIRFHLSDYVTVTDTVFDSNTAEQYGGGVSMHTVNFITFQNATFKNNEAPVGGGGGGIAVETSCGYVTISSCIFDSNNVGEEMGGAILAAGINSEQWSIVDSIFKNNIAELGGGALYFVSWNGHVAIENCNFTYNRADLSGAG